MCVDTPKGPEEALAAVCAGWPSKCAPTSQGAAAGTQHSTWEQGCSTWGQPQSPHIPHKPVLPTLKAVTAGGVKHKTKGRENDKVILHWKGLRWKQFHPEKLQVFLEKRGELENQSSIVSPPSWSSALVNTVSTWCSVLNYILNSETAHEVSETCNYLAALKGSISQKIHLKNVWVHYRQYYTICKRVAIL